ncbi:MAG: aspartate/glutamate racemase family protein [Hyphomicrobiales bacterium]|nr:aspartate/glutamate racemase family protein [Hyphomicrobiales bacterium]MBV8663462.1 aspartate/glutamate racemase family protein [Hyphomicrobiales bacterium]
MRLLVVNPNTTAGMTARIGAAARAVAAAGTHVEAVNPASGPVSIEGYFDEAFAVPGALQEIARGEREGYDAFIIACFDDTGLEAARCVASGPVLGIGEAAFHLASLVAHRFSVVTTLSRSIAPIETNLMKYGLERRCARVRACEVPVLALDDPASGAVERLSAEIERAKAEDGAEAIVLGCAGMADLAASLAHRHGLPVIDGVAAAVKLAETLVSLGHATSKLGPYAAPLPKAFAGVFAGMSNG